MCKNKKHCLKKKKVSKKQQIVSLLKDMLTAEPLQTSVRNSALITLNNLSNVKPSLSPAESASKASCHCHKKRRLWLEMLCQKFRTAQWSPNLLFYLKQEDHFWRIINQEYDSTQRPLCMWWKRVCFLNAWHPWKCCWYIFLRSLSQLKD